MNETQKNRELAYTVLRITLGINIFLHGLIRLGSNYEKFVTWTTDLFASSPLPLSIVNLYAHVIPPSEFLLGLLLILGLFTQATAVAGSILMMTLIFGLSLVQKWDIVGIQMIYSLFYFLLIFLIEYNHYSLDNLWRKRNNIS